MMLLDEFFFSEKPDLESELAADVADLLRQVIEEKGTGSLVVSGGNTPIKMLEKLSRAVLDWSKVNVFLADERWVDPQNDRSNEKMIRACFLKNEAAIADFQGFYTSSVSVENAPEYLETKLEALERPIDILLLGMGEDGHTASLFPCAKNISELLSIDQKLKTVTVKPEDAMDVRISLSFPILVNAKNIFLHMTGEMKMEVFRKIVSGKKAAPLGFVLGETQADIRLYWAA